MIRPRKGILLYNADVITLDSHNPEASWILVLDDRMT
jgi:predicted amidohydrolase YtcJ